MPPEIFDADYLHFYADVLGDERSEAEAAVVARLLSLEPGMRVIDVPCGEGRIAGRLAKRGCDVVGLDASERFLARARERWPDVRFEQGDMRELPFVAEFDALVNWFSSFGYFDSETNDAVLAGFARALRPGGRLLLEQVNPARLARLVEVGGGSSAPETAPCESSSSRSSRCRPRSWCSASRRRDFERPGSSVGVGNHSLRRARG